MRRPHASTAPSVTLTEERNLLFRDLGSMVEGVAVVNASERLLFANPGF